MSQPNPTPQPGAVPVLPLAYAAAARTFREGSPLLDEVRVLLETRTRKGVETYGEALMAPHGRDFLLDAEEEAVDLLQYLAGLRHVGVEPADLARMRRLQALCGAVFNESVEVLSIALRAAGGSP